MKKRTMASVLALTLLLSGCSVSVEEGKELYKNSFDKMEEMDSYILDSTAKMSMELSGMEVETLMELHSEVKDSGKTAAHEMFLSSDGLEQEMRMYQQEDVLYTEIPGEEQYLMQNYEEGAELSYQGLMVLGSDAMAKNYIDAIDSAENITVEKTEEQSIRVSFDFSEESRNAVVGRIVDVLQETMLGDLELQLREEFSALGLSGEDLENLVAQMMEVYESMYSETGVESIHMEATINKDGFMETQDVDMVLTMDMSGIFEALGQPVDEAAAEQLKNIHLNMSNSSTYTDINEEISVTMPEFTEENTLSVEEME